MSETPKHVVTVTDSGSGRYSQRVTVGRHVMATDEPVSNGGQDSGPSPHEYVLAGLGACTAVTLRMCVERHNWMLRRTTVELQHEKIPATDGASKIDHFHRSIHLEGDLTEERRLRLFQVAEKCPVGETHCRLDIGGRPIANSGTEPIMAQLILNQAHLFLEN